MATDSPIPKFLRGPDFEDPPSLEDGPETGSSTGPDTVPGTAPGTGIVPRGPVEDQATGPREGQEPGQGTDLAERLSMRDYALRSLADGTRSAYRRAFAAFVEWCDDRALSPLPATPDTVATWLAAQADRGLAPSTLSLRTAAIAAAHKTAGAADPTKAIIVVKTLAGIRRVKAGPPAAKAPIVAETLVAILERFGSDGRLNDIRDRALLLIGFAAALRRSELAALTVDSIDQVPQGLIVTVVRSKGDQEGKGQRIAIPRGARQCPVQALADWLSAAGIEEGPIFRPITKGGRILPRSMTGRSVATIIKRRAEEAGLDPAVVAGHSLRSGFLTSAAQNRASLWKMAEVSRHRSVETLRPYVQVTDLFDDHAGEGML